MDMDLHTQSCQIVNSMLDRIQDCDTIDDKIALASQALVAADEYHLASAQTDHSFSALVYQDRPNLAAHIFWLGITACPQAIIDVSHRIIYSQPIKFAESGIELQYNNDTLMHYVADKTLRACKPGEYNHHLITAEAGYVETN